GALKRFAAEGYFVRTLPGPNHFTQTSKTGYPVIEEAIALTAVELLGDWMTDHLYYPRVK
ncbi:hypothetical protein KGY64_07815, partial [Candidatus Bipolaricaulota bacterium]|nr:hypothetical protein [Candidatus Bipolaricaulota bacterium]